MESNIFYKSEYQNTICVLYKTQQASVNKWISKYR